MTGQLELGFQYKGSREEFSTAKDQGDRAEASRAALLLLAPVWAPTPPPSKHLHCRTSNMPVQDTSSPACGPATLTTTKPVTSPRRFHSHSLLACHPFPFQHGP